MSECNCKLCLTYHTWRKMLAKIPDETVRAYFHDQLELLDCLEDAHQHHQAIFDGSWPHAVAVLEASLKRAKEVQNTANR